MTIDDVKRDLAIASATLLAVIDKCHSAQRALIDGMANDSQQLKMVIDTLETAGMDLNDYVYMLFKDEGEVARALKM